MESNSIHFVEEYNTVFQIPLDLFSVIFLVLLILSISCPNPSLVLIVTETSSTPMNRECFNFQNANEPFCLAARCTYVWVILCINKQDLFLSSSSTEWQNLSSSGNSYIHHKMPMGCQRWPSWMNLWPPHRPLQSFKRTILFNNMDIETRKHSFKKW